MDNIDRKLINLLQENARYSIKQLADRVYLSPPAITARIEKLEKEGIIKSSMIITDLKKLGYHITAFINLEIEPKQKKEFYPFVESVENVLECNCVTGVYSMLMKVAFPSTEELDKFIGKLQMFGRTQTQVVFCNSVPIRGMKLHIE